MLQKLRSYWAILILLIVTPLLARGDDTSHWATQRKAMVNNQIAARDVTDSRVLAAMSAVPRHRFVPPNVMRRAYGDHPLPIGEGQTISQPYIVALMTASLDLAPDAHVLEIGTGSGYQAAVLAQLVQSVISMEIKAPLHRRATRVLRELGMDTVTTIHGDGYFGQPDAGPFDAIMITAAVDHIPPPLLAQLKPGGRLILPLGNPFSYQNLVLVTKTGEDYTVRNIIGVLFVPLTGHALTR